MSGDKIPGVFSPQMEAIVDIIRHVRFSRILVRERGVGSITLFGKGNRAPPPNSEERHERAAEIEPKRGVEHFD